MSQFEVEPIGARTLIEIVEGDTESDSGLLLANDNNMQLPVMGKVLKIGGESVFTPGEVLLFRRYAVDELKFNFKGDETKIYLVDDADVIGRVTNFKAK